MFNQAHIRVGGSKSGLTDSTCDLRYFQSYWTVAGHVGIKHWWRFLSLQPSHPECVGEDGMCGNESVVGALDGLASINRCGFTGKGDKMSES